MKKLMILAALLTTGIIPTSSSAFSLRFHMFRQKQILGGIKSISGIYTVHTFQTTGTATLSTTSPITNLEYLVVGGGGGSAYYSGGGGGGGVKTGTISSLPAGSYNVTIGNGGLAYAGISSSINYGGNGEDSVFNTTTAKGGGGGGGGWAGLIPTPVRQPASGFVYGYSPLNIWQLDGSGNVFIYWNGATIASGLTPGITEYTIGSVTYYKGSYAAGTDYRIYRVETQNIASVGSINGRPGGNGGGGGNSEGASLGGISSDGTGFSGGAGTSGTAGTRGGAGGGGAGGAGQNGAASGGNGGIGITSPITGIMYGCGGGGNGGGTPTGPVGSGGCSNAGSGGAAGAGGANGVANTGGGAGGGGNGNGSSGGSGVVILRYVTSQNQ